MMAIRIIFSTTVGLCALGTLVQATVAEELPQLYAIDNEGASVRLLPAGDYFKAANPAEDLGTVGSGITVQLLERKRDAAVTVIEWAKVKVLEGPVKGKMGWVMFGQLRDIPDRPLAPDPADNVQPRLSRTGTETDAAPKELYVISDAAKLYRKPGYAAAANPANVQTTLTKGTVVGELARWKDAQLLAGSYVWYQVRVLDGPSKDEEGWISNAYLGSVVFRVLGNSTGELRNIAGQYGSFEDFAFRPSQTDWERGAPVPRYVSGEGLRDQALLSGFLRGETAGNTNLLALVPDEADVTEIVNPMLERFFARPRC